MSKIRIKNVGPIKRGAESDNGFIDFSGVTVFIGDQGRVVKYYYLNTTLQNCLTLQPF